MITVIIVSWNVRELLRACLASLAAHPCALCEQRVIVVDNASSDGSAQMVRESFPDVTVVANATNRGFSGGNNDGLARARIEWQSVVGARHGQADMRPLADHYALLLNPDTEVTPGALDELVGFADVNNAVGIVGPQLLYPDGRVQSSRRRFPTLALACVESTWAQAKAPRALLDHYYANDLPDGATNDVDWLVGAALLVRDRAIEQAGVLDEQTFFMYSEELDWCKRIKDAGWRVVYHPRARVIHHEGASSSQVSAQRMIHFNTSKVRYFKKHYGAAQSEILRQSLLGQFRSQLRMERIKAAIGHKRTLRLTRIAAYAAVIASGLR